jgi:restriction system protein
MAVPDYQSYMKPMLELLVGSDELRITDITARMAEHFALTQEDLADMVPSGAKSRHVDRVGWAAAYLKQAGLLESPRRAFYRISPDGRAALATGDEINSAYLERYDKFQAFRSRKRGGEAPNPEPDPDNGRTPDEVLDDTYQSLRDGLAQEILDRLHTVPPDLFEQIVIDLLLAMGYGGSGRDAARRVGRSGDGGIDGLINEDRLGLDVVYIQAKRWQGTVGTPNLRDFAGSLEERKAVKGVFITTSDFTKDARDFVNRIGKRIILINGEDLAQYMIDYDIGVKNRTTYVIKKLDEDYFEAT